MRVVWSLAGLVVVAACSAPVEREPDAGTTGSPTSTSPPTESRDIDPPPRVFSEGSFWYDPLPPTTPLDPRSSQMVPWLKNVGVAAYGNADRDLPSTTINTTHYSATLYRTDAGDPAVTVTWEDCQGQPDPGPELRRQFEDVRIPEDAVPGGGSDAPMSLYDTTRDRYTDLWQAEKTDQGWTACWGGTIENASDNPGYFEAPYGATASGLPMQPGSIKVDELRGGHIPHVLALSVPVMAVNDVISWPAQRTDGASDEPLALSEGQRLRLPADLDLDDLDLNPTTRAVARAVQEYGAVVVDRSGAFTFHAESPRALSDDPYPRLFDGRESHSVLWGDASRGEDPFPFDELVVLPVDWGRP